MIREIENIELKFLTVDDYEELKTAMIDSYTSMPNSVWKKEHINSLIQKFPDGQVVIKVNGQLAGCALSIIVDYNSFDANLTYKDITGNKYGHRWCDSTFRVTRAHVAEPTSKTY